MTDVMSQVNREFLFLSIWKRKRNDFLSLSLSLSSSSKLTKLSTDKKKMSLCQKQRQQIIISITHTSTFNVANKDKEMSTLIYTKEKKLEANFLPNTVHNEARSLLVLSSAMSDEYVQMWMVCSMINTALVWLAFSSSLFSSFPLDSRARSIWTSEFF